MLLRPFQGCMAINAETEGDVLRTCPWLLYSAPSALGTENFLEAVFRGIPRYH